MVDAPGVDDSECGVVQDVIVKCQGEDPLSVLMSHVPII
jgi:hypothetical protein